MTDRHGEFDWDACWAGDLTEYDGWSEEFGPKLARTLSQLFVDVGQPDIVASVGCGPATTLLELADTHPGSRFYGYDVSPQAIERARERRDDRGVDNVTLAVDSIPHLETDRRFAFVYSIATLHYVADIEAAVRSLWRRVEAQGHLAVNYPTPFHRAELMPRLVEDWEEVGFESESRAWVRERFRHVLDGENILTEERLGAVLQRTPRDIRTYDVEMPTEIGEEFRLSVLKR